jgi:phosphoribosylanthranilate isomerase
MIIKVCGMREAENIREVEQCSMLNDQCSIDWMGFIFWPKSSRFVSQVPAYLPKHCQRVGVFVDASIGDIMSAVDSFALNYIQLHGQESPSYIIQLKPHLPADVKIIKAFNIIKQSLNLQIC